MAMRMKRADLEFLTGVADLGGARLTQAEIAERMGFNSLGAMLGKVRGLGFRVREVPGSEVVMTLTDEPLTDLVESGALVAADEPETCGCAR